MKKPKEFAFRQGETLKTAAISLGRTVYKGASHVEAVEEAMKDMGGYDNFVRHGLKAGGSTGFITSRDRFVQRNEATNIARKTGVKMRDPDYVHGDEVGDVPSTWGHGKWKKE